MPVGWPPFEPVGDVVAILALCIAFVLACLDCHLRHDRRPLPMVTTTAALAVLWVAHLVAFSGVIPGIRGLGGEITASWVFLMINLAAPALLAPSLLHRRGHVNSCWVIAHAMSAGIMGGLGLAVVAWLVASSPLGASGGESPSPIAPAIGAAGMVPVALAAYLLLQGHRGDGRVLWAVLIALGLSFLAAVVLVLAPAPPARETLFGNAAMLLGLMTAGALLAGMLGLYPVSVRAEQEVQRERVFLLRRALDASDAERRRIARDLHDSAVQDLAAVSYSLAGTSRRVAGEGRPELAELLDQAAVTTRHTMAGLRSLIVDIYPPNLHKEGLEAALTDLCASARSRGLTVRLDVTTGLDMSEQAAATVYRIAQEAVRNTLRHSRAEELSVSLVQDDGLVRLEVADNGRGFVDSRAGADGHIGLRLLSDLAREAGGRLEVKSGPGSGAIVRLEMSCS
jgi:signal transduction histidine kinase